MNEPVFIIAEAGVNHNGDMGLARDLVHVAAESGADAIKFQTFKGESFVSTRAEKAKYQKDTTGAEESQLAMIKKLEFPYDAHAGIKELCEKLNIEFMSTPFEEESADFLHNLGMKRFKIPSGDINNFPLLRKIASFNKPIIFSTGMANEREIAECLEILQKFGALEKDISVLHCNTEYPSPFSDVNLRAIKTLRDSFAVKVGYSDHTLGTEVAIAATALGATIIEKHFTLSRELPGPDHRASLEPDELKDMIRAIRNITLALGQAQKTPTPSELKNIPIARKSIVAGRSIKRGETLDETNLMVKRPANGINPMLWPTVVGTKAARDFETDEPIEL